jgi:hypothetical protein
MNNTILYHPTLGKEMFGYVKKYKGEGKLEGYK